MAELIRDLAGSSSPIHYVAGAQDDPRRHCPDIRLARDALGWKPKVGPEEGLAETVAWFRGVGAAGERQTA